MGPQKEYSKKPKGRRARALRPFCCSLRAPFQERPQLARARRMAQLAERLGFDLPDALARDGEALADFLERVLAAVADAEPHLDHLFLARRERLEDRVGLLLEVQVDHGVRG